MEDPEECEECEANGGGADALCYGSDVCRLLLGCSSRFSIATRSHSGDCTGRSRVAISGDGRRGIAGESRVGTSGESRIGIPGKSSVGIHGESDVGISRERVGLFGGGSVG